jgi:CheY-like chemotaxis protein
MNRRCSFIFTALSVILLLIISCTDNNAVNNREIKPGGPYSRILTPGHQSGQQTGAAPFLIDNIQADNQQSGKQLTSPRLRETDLLLMGMVLLVGISQFIRFLFKRCDPLPLILSVFCIILILVTGAAGLPVEGNLSKALQGCYILLAFLFCCYFHHFLPVRGFKKGFWLLLPFFTALVVLLLWLPAWLLPMIRLMHCLFFIVVLIICLIKLFYVIRISRPAIWYLVLFVMLIGSVAIDGIPGIMNTARFPGTRYIFVFFIFFEFILYLVSLEKRSVLIDDTAAGSYKIIKRVSHELRTPLYSIIGIAESLRENRQGAFDNNQLRNLSIILSKAFYLAKVINRLMESTAIPESVSPRLKAGKSPGGNSPPDYTILITDDDPVNLMIINEQVTSAGYKTITSSTGKDLLNIVFSSDAKIDLIILDVKLPDISGYRLCREIRNKYSRFELPVIFFSANAHPDDRSRGLAAGANIYLSKPVSKTVLLTTIVIQLSETREVDNGG